MEVFSSGSNTNRQTRRKLPSRPLKKRQQKAAHYPPGSEPISLMSGKSKALLGERYAVDCCSRRCVTRTFPGHSGSLCLCNSQGFLWRAGCTRRSSLPDFPSLWSSTVLLLIFSSSAPWFSLTDASKSSHPQLRYLQACNAFQWFISSAWNPQLLLGTSYTVWTCQTQTQGPSCAFRIPILSKGMLSETGLQTIQRYFFPYSSSSLAPWPTQ